MFTKRELDLLINGIYSLYGGHIPELMANEEELNKLIKRLTEMRNESVSKS